LAGPDNCEPVWNLCSGPSVRSSFRMAMPPPCSRCCMVTRGISAGCHAEDE